MEYNEKEKSSVHLALLSLAVGTLHVWHYAVSPLFGSRCRFYPSCSEYACEAISRYGFLRGGWISLKRLLHCHPLCSGGIDRVP